MSLLCIFLTGKFTMIIALDLHIAGVKRFFTHNFVLLWMHFACVNLPIFLCKIYTLIV